MESEGTTEFNVAEILNFQMECQGVRGVKARSGYKTIKNVTKMP